MYLHRDKLFIFLGIMDCKMNQRHQDAGAAGIFWTKNWIESASKYLQWDS